MFHEFILSADVPILFLQKVSTREAVCIQLSNNDGLLTRVDHVVMLDTTRAMNTEEHMNMWKSVLSILRI